MNGLGDGPVGHRFIPLHAPRLGAGAPDFAGLSTQGTIWLSDYRGRWLVFFAHPADFTPVCSSEVVAFARHAGDFQALNCALLGLSADTAEVHAAWCESIKRQYGVSVDFPILEDPSLRIAHDYDMELSGGAGTVRALFVIDPQGVVRAMLHYPCETGRSVAEVLRLVQALQAADRSRAMTPEGWQPGQLLLESVLPAANARSDAALGCVEWYRYVAAPPPTP